MNLKKLIISFLLLSSFILIIFLIQNDSTKIYENSEAKLSISIEIFYSLEEEFLPENISSLDINLVSWYFYPRDSVRQEIISQDQLNLDEFDNLVVPINLSVKNDSFIFNSIISTEKLIISNEITNMPYPLEFSDLEILQLSEFVQFDQANNIELIPSSLINDKLTTFEIIEIVGRFIVSDIDYVLNEENLEKSQSLEWILSNKEGVCDEFTILNVAVLRSLGLPTRYVSGLIYTEHEYFDYPWQMHSWFEVYFPTEGWVPFDPLLEQYGFIDVSHIELFYSTYLPNQTHNLDTFPYLDIQSEWEVQVLN